MICPLILAILTMSSKASDLDRSTVTNSIDKVNPQTYNSYIATDIPLARTLIDDLKADIKGEPVSHLQAGPVAIVVTSNYNDIVLDEGKDALLMYYNPFCPPCQKVAPIYEELGRLSQGYTEKLVVAKIDETINKFPDDVFYTPCFKLFPSGSKNSPVELKNPDHSLESLAHLIRNYGFYKIDLLKEFGIHNKRLDTEQDFAALPTTILVDYTLREDAMRETMPLSNPKSKAVKDMVGDERDEL